MSRPSGPRWPEFNASNVEGTCLWCGLKLRQQHNVKVEYVRVDVSTRACRHCGAKALSEHGWCEQCGQLGADPNKRTVLERTKRYDKPGDYGDGYFCGLRCAYSWAVALADHGRRLQPQGGGK